MYCKKCGKRFRANVKFCDACGEELEDELNVYGEQFQLGVISSFEKIFRDTENWVRSAVCKKLLSCDVEDCMQEIYVKLYENIGKFNPNKGNFRSWFNVLVKNTIIDYYRKRERKQGQDISMYYEDNENPVEFISEDISLRPEIYMEQQESKRLMKEILQNIPQEQRACILLYYSEELKQKEIAQRLNIPEGTVKTRLLHGKNAVKESVLMLEKKQGTKLYGMSPIAFFIWVSHAQISDILWENVQDSTLKSVLAEGSTFEHVVSGMKESASGGDQVLGADGVSGTGKTGENLAGGVKNAAAGKGVAAGKYFAAKIVAGVAAVAVIGGTAGTVAYRQINRSQQIENETKEPTINQAEENADISIYDYLEKEGYQYVGDDREGSLFEYNSQDDYRMLPIANYKDGFWTFKEADYDGDGENEYLVISIAHGGEDDNRVNMSVVEHTEGKWETADTVTVENTNWLKSSLLDYIGGDSNPRTNKKNYRLDVVHRSDFFYREQEDGIHIFMEDNIYQPAILNYENVGSWALQEYRYSNGKLVKVEDIGIPTIEGAAIGALTNSEDPRYPSSWGDENVRNTLQLYEFNITGITDSPIPDQDNSLTKIGTINNAYDRTNYYQNISDWLAQQGTYELEAFHFSYLNNAGSENELELTDKEKQVLAFQAIVFAKHGSGGDYEEGEENISKATSESGLKAMTFSLLYGRESIVHLNSLEALTSEEMNGQEVSDPPAAYKVKKAEVADYLREAYGIETEPSDIVSAAYVPQVKDDSYYVFSTGFGGPISSDVDSVEKTENGKFMIQGQLTWPDFAGDPTKTILLPFTIEAENNPDSPLIGMKMVSIKTYDKTILE